MATGQALEIYYAAAELARDPAHAKLIPHVERMRAAYERGFGTGIPARKGCGDDASGGPGSARQAFIGQAGAVTAAINTFGAKGAAVAERQTVAGRCRAPDGAKAT